MKTFNDLYLHIKDSISDIYDDRESINIAKIVLEDSFLVDFSSAELISEIQKKEAENIILRLQNHEPVQYITQKAFFWDYIFHVEKGVLIPRVETEELVYQIYQDFKGKNELTILDIGTGSGCIPITLSLKLDCKRVVGIDISEDALAIANKNAVNLKADVLFYKFDILNEKRESNFKYKIIVSNPPYIPVFEKKMMPKHVLDFEPHIALFTENDALVFYRKIIDFAILHLEKEGRLYFECNEFNAEEVKQLLEEKPFHSVFLQKDMRGRNRIISATHN
jgi:release factor glutamine methyltransferase